MRTPALPALRARKRGRGALVATAAVIILAGCTEVTRLLDPTPPTVRVESVSMTGLSLTQARARLKLAIDNPNPVGLKVDSVRYALTTGGTRLAEGLAEQGVSLPAQGRGTAEIDIGVDLLKAADSAMTLLNREALAYAMEGQVGVGPFALPYAHSGEFALPQMPGISLAGLRLTEMGLSRAQAELDLTIDNPNAFVLRLAELAGQLSLNGRSIGRVRARNVEVGPSGRARVSLPIELRLADLGAGLIGAIRSAQPVNVAFDGGMTTSEADGSTKQLAITRAAELALSR